MSAPAAPAVYYPDSDGKRMADNTQQFRWIGVLAGNLAALFRDRPDVFVSGDQLWYPVEGEPNISTAPDVYVVFGRPKGDRGSYRQWEEGGVPMTVVFEINSPGNTVPEMADKLAFYDDYGVEEYYFYDPDSNALQGWARRGSVLARVRPMHGHVSPRLGVRFDLSRPELVVYRPDGRPFLTFEQLEEERERAERRAAEAVQQAAESARQAAESAQQAAEANRRAEQAEQRAARLAALTLKGRSQQLTPEEAAELERLLQQPPGG
jgi:Uma2 family endonuclease